jgi:hypothetical protein
MKVMQVILARGASFSLGEVKASSALPLGHLTLGHFGR